MLLPNMEWVDGQTSSMMKRTVPWYVHNFLVIYYIYAVFHLASFSSFDDGADISLVTVDCVNTLVRMHDVAMPYRK